MSKTIFTFTEEFDDAGHLIKRTITTEQGETVLPVTPNTKPIDNMPFIPTTTPWTAPMNPKEFELAACTAISRYFNDNADVTGVYLSPDDIYTVWSCKTLQNNKGLFTTPVKDGLYYEATYNGDKQELYIDCYQKLKNFAVKVSE